DQIGVEDVAVAKSGAVGDEFRDVEELDQRDVAVDDQVGAADVEIIAAAAGQILELPTSAVVSKIEPEPALCESVEQRLVEFLRLRGQRDLGLSCQRQRYRYCDQVAIFQWRALVVERVGQLRARLDLHYHRRAALHQRRARAGRM